MSNKKPPKQLSQQAAQYGNGSILTAADSGEINGVQLIGETGRWYFPFNKNCTVVFGDKVDGNNQIIQNVSE